MSLSLTCVIKVIHLIRYLIFGASMASGFGEVPKDASCQKEDGFAYPLL